MRGAVWKLDARAHERLWRLGERNHAEPKGQAQTHLSFVEAHFANGEYRRRHVSDSDRRIHLPAPLFDPMTMIMENRCCVMSGTTALASKQAGGLQ
jgi:hypothetical protein